MTLTAPFFGPTGSGLSGRILAVFAGLNEKGRQYGLYRRTLRDLGELSERELSDLGLDRSEIESVARQAAYGN